MSFSYPSDYKYPKGDIPKWEGTELPVSTMSSLLPQQLSTERRRESTTITKTRATKQSTTRSSPFITVPLWIMWMAAAATTTTVALVIPTCEAFSTNVPRVMLRQSPLKYSKAPSATSPSTTALNMAGVRTRGLEQKREGPTPTEGGMTLYLKAAEDGQSVGDCPFAHNVRMVLEEKGLDYDLKPTSPDGKPRWLLEYYDGKMPALRHRKECYVESSVIVDYLEYFFPEPSLTPKDDHGAADVLDGFFPAVAKFLKDTEDSDETTNNLKTKLQSFEDHLSKLPDGSFLCGQDFTLLDCRVVPQLYHLQVGIDGYKNGLPALAKDFPKTYAYMQTCFARPSFQASNYPAETVLWGWGNARK